MEHRHADEDRDGQQLDKDHGHVDAGALPHAQHEQDHEDQDDAGGRQVDDAAQGGGLGQGIRQGQAHGGEGVVEIAGPAVGHGGGGHPVFQDQIPADDPGDQLAEGRVAVAVGAAAAAHGGGEFGIGQGREGAGDSGDDEGEHHRRPGLGGGGDAGEHEDTGADDRPDPEQGEIKGGEAFVEAGVVKIVRGGGLGAENFHGFPFVRRFERLGRKPEVSKQAGFTSPRGRRGGPSR